MSSQNQDSPLSTTASVLGILTFVYAVTAGVLGYLYLLRSFPQADASIERFYDAFAACALESDLVRRDILSTHSSFAIDGSIPAAVPAPRFPQVRPSQSQTATQATPQYPPPNSQSIPPNQYQHPLPAATGYESGQDGAYLLDPDSLGRLYSHVRTVEIELQRAAAKVIAARPTGDEDGSRSLLDKLLGRGRWISRARELEASLGKREALTARLLVVQLSLASGRMRVQKEALEGLEKRLDAQEQDIAKLKQELNERGTGDGIMYTNGHSNGLRGHEEQYDM